MQGKTRKPPVPIEGSSFMRDLESLISSYCPLLKKGQWTLYLTPGEGKWPVGVIKLRDFYGFGLEKQLEAMARSLNSRGL